MVRKKCVCAAADHASREVTHDRGCLKMEIAEHFVRAPSAEEANDIGVDLGTEKGIGSRCSEAASTDVGWKEAEGRAKESDCVAECGGDVGWCDFNPGGTSEGTC